MLYRLLLWLLLLPISLVAMDANRSPLNQVQCLLLDGLVTSILSQPVTPETIAKVTRLQSLTSSGLGALRNLPANGRSSGYGDYVQKVTSIQSRIDAYLETNKPK